MKEQEEDLQSLMQKVERRERTARKRAIIYSLVPIILAVVLLSYTSYRIIKAQKEYATINQKLQVAKEEAEHFAKEATELKQTLSEVEEQLRQSTNFVKRVFQIDWGDAKVLGSRYPRQSELLFHILEMRDQGVGWKLGGTSPDEGFDSPSFAAYVLEKHHLLDIPFSERYRIRELLSPTTDPQVGDLIFYDTGYTMFYFKDQRDNPFCVGMTPVGIVALQIEFGPRLLGYGRVNY
jgi:hypothetical protein